MDGAYRALEQLRGAKAISAIGVGVNDAEMCERFAAAGDFDVMLLAGRYSLLEQPALQSFLPTAERKGLGVLLGGVFNSGILATGARPGAHYNYAVAPPAIMARVERIEAVCHAHGTRLADAALQFPLAHPAVSSIVLGATSAQEVRRNIASRCRVKFRAACGPISRRKDCSSSTFRFRFRHDTTPLDLDCRAIDGRTRRVRAIAGVWPQSRRHVLVSSWKGPRMLKGIDPILTPDLLWLMASMGHGDDLAVVDANHPAERIARASVTGRLIRLPGLHLPQVIGAISRSYRSMRQSRIRSAS